ncbi:MAG: DUF3598 family protein [Knoellia sp.]
MSLWPEFPVLSDHLGQWEGEYVHLDPDGREIDRHASHLLATVPEDGSYDIHQVNTYTWADGRREQVEFGGTLKGKDIHFDNDRILGSMHQIDSRTILLVWSYKTLLEPGNSVHEVIQLSEDGQEKVRSWHWMESDRLVRRTVIRERKVA